MAYRKAAPRPLKPAFLDRAKRAIHPADRITHTSPYGLAWWALFGAVLFGALAGAAAAPTHRKLVCAPADERGGCTLVDYHLALVPYTRAVTSVSAHDVSEEGWSLLIQAEGGPVWVRTNDAELIAREHRHVGTTPLPGLPIIPVMCLALAAFFAVLMARLARRSRLKAFFAQDLLRVEIASPVRLPVVEHPLSKLEVSSIESVDDSDWHEVVLRSPRGTSGLRGSNAECRRLRRWVLAAVDDAKAVAKHLDTASSEQEQ
ncbi:MAG: hypothetical protein JNK04_25980 [Myxococcales bacterium]|nr:hypothetical protein [Myxococcales bacterium]